ncbi:hypothetical protein IJ541_10985 [bacterium]|nr:hypothetical protein [bacterium]
MTQIRFQNIQIYKTIFILLGAFILYGSTLFGVETLAVEFGVVKYNEGFIDYTKFDKASVLKSADEHFNKALEVDGEERKLFLQQAGGEYFVLNKLEPNNLYPIVQMARIYDFEHKNSYAKAYFYQALDINKTDAYTNYHFGEFYYTRNDYKKALDYYNIAFKNGYKENYDVLIKMAVMYEKLGDLLRANQYYKKAYLVKPDNTELPDKIRALEDLKYKNTGYYNRRRKK